MMQFVRLIAIDSEAKLQRGTVIRLLGKVPYEAVVDFMVIEGYDPDRGMSLMVSSGYKAGLTLVSLPKDSGKFEIDINWLKENWSHWVYPECPVEDVWVCDGYPVPTELPST